MRSQNAGWRALPIAGDAERTLPDARRLSARCTEGNKNALKHERYTAEAIANRRRARAEQRLGSKRAPLNIGMRLRGSASHKGRQASSSAAQAARARRWARGWSPLPKSVGMLIEFMLRYGLKPRDLIGGSFAHQGSKKTSGGTFRDH
jgi:hypothetical protein